MLHHKMGPASANSSVAEFIAFPIHTLLLTLPIHMTQPSSIHIVGMFILSMWNQNSWCQVSGSPASAVLMVLLCQRLLTDGTFNANKIEINTSSGLNLMWTITIRSQIWIILFIYIFGHCIDFYFLLRWNIWYHVWCTVKINLYFSENSI